MGGRRLQDCAANRLGSLTCSLPLSLRSGKSLPEDESLVASKAGSRKLMDNWTNLGPSWV